MAMQPAPYSDEFAATARAEADRLSLRAIELRSRASQWIARGEAILHDAEALESRVQELDELLGRAPQLRIDLQTRELQGQQLREEATRILLRRLGTGAPIHYREWYALMRSHGIEANGKDPLATFLTQITRSPIVERVEGATGVYQLNPQGALDGARAELSRTQQLVNRLRESRPGASSEALGDAERRVEQARRRFEAVLQARMVLTRAKMTS